MSDISLVFRGFGQRPPPFLDLVIDLEIKNSSHSVQWYFLPSYLDGQAEFPDLLVSAVEIFELPGAGRVRIARFISGKSFQALRLPAGAQIRVHKFPITCIGDPPHGTVQVPVQQAAGWQIGKQRAEDWLPTDLTCSMNAEVTEEPGAIIASKDNPKGAVLPMTRSGAHSWMVPVRLERKK